MTHERFVRRLWSAEDDAKLRQMHAAGASAREIGNALGSVSRDAVIGRLRRLGLGAPKTSMAATTPHQRTERSVPTLAELVPLKSS